MDILTELGCLLLGMFAMGIVWFVSDNGENSPYDRGFKDGYEIAEMKLSDSMRERSEDETD